MPTWFEVVQACSKKTKNVLFRMFDMASFEELEKVNEIIKQIFWIRIYIKIWSLIELSGAIQSM